MQLLAFTALLALAADSKPDFKVTAEKLTGAYKEAMGKPTKYQGKIIEVTGAFHIRRPGTGDVLLRGHTPGVHFVSCTPTKAAAALHQRLYGLARGQRVTFRGKEGGNRFSPVLGECEVVRVGPSPVRTVTIAKFAALPRTPAAAKKLEGKAVLARVRVVDIDKSEKSRVTYTVADAANKSKTAPTTKVVVDTGYDSERTKELHAVKKGETGYALGVAHDLTGTPRFWDAVLLKKAPTGVKK